jgi:hypothetical protein
LKTSGQFVVYLFASAGYFSDSAVLFALRIKIAAIVVCAIENHLYSRSLASLGSCIATAVLAILRQIHSIICPRATLRTWVRMVDHITDTAISF